jgi:aspartyl-tRNA(Asn)/glutamyl-tRNA(Gln) amidotransferase subunit C
MVCCTAPDYARGFRTIYLNNEGSASMSLDLATTRRIAKLARIGLEDAELEATTQKLNSILGWIDQLAEVNVDGVPPMVGTETEALRQREDVVNDGNCRDALLACAPETAGPFYTVPKVVE